MQVIAVDGGRSKIKVAAENAARSFLAKIGDSREMDIGENSDYVVTVNGQGYFVGDMAMESYSIREMATKSKQHEETKILFATAIASVVTDKEVSIVTGLPINQHSSSKTSMQHFLSGDYNVVLNGVEKKFRVCDVGIVPEGSGIYKRLNFDKKNSVIRVLQLGSVTTNALTVVNGRFWDKESTCLDWGMFQLDIAGDSDKQKEQFARKIKGDLSKVWLTYKADTDIVVLAGGGALRMGKQLKDQYTVTHMSEDPVMDDVLGFYEMGVLKWQGR